MDLNSDVGELPDDITSGLQEALLALVERANVACGGHAGDDATMDATVAQCARLGVLVGAHPSYPDRAHFGRRRMEMDRSALLESVRAQVQALDVIARAHGVTLAHIKLHGALYHDAAHHPDVARVVVDACAPWEVPLVLPVGAATLPLVRSLGREVLLEAFADRGYTPEGALIPRGAPGALVHHPEAAAAQARALLERWPIDTLCVHGDTLGALALVHAVRTAIDRTRTNPA